MERATIWLGILLSTTLLRVHCVREGNMTATENIASHVVTAILTRGDKRMRPQVYGPPVEVICDFYIVGLGEINEVNMDYLLDIYFRMEWQDKRLVYDELEGPLVLASYEDSNVIWIPDIYFPNEKKANFHSVTRPNRRLSIYRNGTVKSSMRLTITLACPMLLTYFPLDRQECLVKIASYSYTKEDLDLKWSDYIPIETRGERLTLPQFEILDIRPDTCREDYKTGEFACIKATFKMKRQYGFFVLRTYIPSMLIVILSWISFWIHKGAVPARITLGVTTVLAMTTQLGSSHSGNVRVSYPKAIDVWYTFCMILVFGALIEYALVTVVARWEEEDKNGETAEGNELQPAGTGRNSRRKSIYAFCRNKLKADGVDRVSQIVFPVAFVLFNLLYWVIYLRPSMPSPYMS